VNRTGAVAGPGLLTTTAWQLEQKSFSPPASLEDTENTEGTQRKAPFTPSPHHLITSSAIYALEGSVFVTGAAVQWLRDELQIIRTAGEIEGLAASVPDNGGVYFVPAFVGLAWPTALIFLLRSKSVRGYYNTVRA